MIVTFLKRLTTLGHNFKKGNKCNATCLGNDCEMCQCFNHADECYFDPQVKQGNTQAISFEILLVVIISSD
jgi:hypothetical protein